jgi:HSP20 family protein
MPITRFDPLRDLFALQNRVNSIFQDFSPNRAENDNLTATAAFVPPVDIYENEHQVVLKLEVPGIPKEDLDIQVENHTVTVRGERKFENAENAENYHRVERRYGSFYRAFSLPDTVDTEHIRADYENGVLRLTAEKRSEAN